MSRPRIIAGGALALAGLALLGCATVKPVVYGPIGPETPHGYRDKQGADGGYTVLVAMPGMTPPASLRDFFDRRAAELCPGGVERKNIFRMTRNNYTLENYGAQVPMPSSRIYSGDELEGYVYCKPAPPAVAEAAKEG